MDFVIKFLNKIINLRLKIINQFELIIKHILNVKHTKLKIIYKLNTQKILNIRFY